MDEYEDEVDIICPLCKQENPIWPRFKGAQIACGYKNFPNNKTILKSFKQNKIINGDRKKEKLYYENIAK